MNLEDLATRWTVRLALACYVLSLALRLNARQRVSLNALARTLWTVGFIAFLAHIASAFHFVHHWSHRAAYLDTAEKTLARTGFYWGGGLYLNYLFALIWGSDVLWWWRSPENYLTRPRVIEPVVHGFMLFMAFNATVVFGTGVIRWAGGVGVILVLAAMLFSLRR